VQQIDRHRRALQFGNAAVEQIAAQAQAGGLLVEGHGLFQVRHVQIDQQLGHGLALARVAGWVELLEVPRAPVMAFIGKPCRQ
jgi:hypothetical protein